MRLFLIPIIIFVLINIGIDGYIYVNIAKRCPKYPALKWVYLLVSALLFVLIVVAMSLPVRSGDDGVLLAINKMLFIYLTFYIPKYVYFIFDIISRLPLLLHKKRWKWLGRIGALAAAVTFGAFWWGALINRYNIDVKEVVVQIAGLPESFEGYRILQFSDFHTGTYGTDTTFVEKVVEAINVLHPDAVFFTGDIVNRHSTELLPFVSPLSRVQTQDSVIAILGNHDYGDYYQWPDTASKHANMQLLYSLFDRMGWKLLRNETTWLVKGNDSIAVIGVENIGDPPFPVYGSLIKSYPDISDDKIKILLSHNPAHWVDSISGHEDVQVALTLSGHTHAMQMSFWGWSPAEWRYKTWGGKYEDQDGIHQLYVNIGVGTVGLPMRIGATPELTMITLTGKPINHIDEK